VSRMTFGFGETSLGYQNLGTNDTDGQIAPIVDPSTTNWGKSKTVGGELCRPFGDFGGRYVHAPFVIKDGGAISSDSWIELLVRPSKTHLVLVQVYDTKLEAYVTIGTVEPALDGGWRSLRWRIWPEDKTVGDAADGIATVALPNSDTGGKAMARIMDFNFFDEAGNARHTLLSGEPAKAVVQFEAHGIPRLPIVVVAIYRPDGTVISQLISATDGKSEASMTGTFEANARLEELLIGPGDYIASVGLFWALDPTKPPEDSAYDLKDRSYALKIVDADYVKFPTGLVRQSASWSISRCE
jgi:lipopolysaccharide transport system ATP-binding protein